MSIATLKKKSDSTYGSSHSRGNQGFSLNGGIRTNTYIGKTALGEHYPRTLMKGNVARGHGGSYGTYNNTPIVSSFLGNTTEDSSVIKSSVVNTRGMTAMKYRWVRRPYPHSIVKPNNWVKKNPFRPFCL
jgi:hypothetical protein